MAQTPVRPQRWRPATKAALIERILKGELTPEAACAIYNDLSLEELDEWLRLYQEHGKPGLRTTKLQDYGGHHRRQKRAVKKD